MLKALDYGAACPGVSTNGINPSSVNEDCLTINIFTPNTERCGRSQLPVVVYFGESSNPHENPYTIMDQCVVYVTFNYRIGFVGFASLGLAKYSGNMGLKDQRLALKWVNNHIGAFGGDNRRITIFGEKSGQHRLRSFNGGIFELFNGKLSLF